MLQLLRHYRRRIAWLPLLLMLAGGLSLFAQGCLAAASSAWDRAEHNELAGHARHDGHAGHSGDGTMPCCERPGDCGGGVCLEPACPGMQSADRQVPPALAEIRIHLLPEPAAIPADSPPRLPGLVPPQRLEAATGVDPGDHPAQRHHRLRI